MYIYDQKKKQGIEDEEYKKAAIETIKELTEIIQDEGNYFDSYGEILYITGDYKKSIEMYKKALEAFKKERNIMKDAREPYSCMI